jgi:hypothetical protein
MELILIVLLVLFLLKRIFQQTDYFGDPDFEKAIEPPEFNSKPLDAYIEPWIWEKPVLFNNDKKWPIYTRNF